ncbi:MAG: malate dehydrogenase [Flavobacteriales bacterium]|nr:malate dehydrogenase [Flavobacteriales bacterium]
MKITVVGAGAVGASCAEYIAIKNFASEVVLLDIKENFAEGKAMDLMQTSSLNYFDTKIIGSTNDYSKTKNSNIAIITSGIPRKPGMTREELIGINAGIVNDVVSQLLKYSPEVILVIVSNPMDTMTYLVNKQFNLEKNKVIGMGGILDSARFKYRIAEALQCPISDVDGMVIGGHSDTGMIPLIGKATRNGISIDTLLTNSIKEKIVHETKIGGATLTSMLGTSAWYAPGAAVSSLVHSIACDQRKMFPCSVYLNGEYNLDDICIGVPAIIGSNGVHEIIKLDLSENETEDLKTSARSVKSTNLLLDSIDLK